MRDRLVERGLDALVGDREDHVLDRLGQRGERGKAGDAEHRARVPGLTAYSAAFETAVQQVLDGVAPDRAGALGRADDGDRAGSEQRIEPVRHVDPRPGGAQKSAAGVARRRGGS